MKIGNIYAHIESGKHYMVTGESYEGWILSNTKDNTTLTASDHCFSEKHGSFTLVREGDETIDLGRFRFARIGLRLGVVNQDPIDDGSTVDPTKRTGIMRVQVSQVVLSLIQVDDPSQEGLYYVVSHAVGEKVEEVCVTEDKDEATSAFFERMQQATPSINPQSKTPEFDRIAAGTVLRHQDGDLWELAAQDTQGTCHMICQQGRDCWSVPLDRMDEFQVEEDALRLFEVVRDNTKSINRMKDDLRHYKGELSSVCNRLQEALPVDQARDGNAYHMLNQLIEHYETQFDGHKHENEMLVSSLHDASYHEAAALNDAREENQPVPTETIGAMKVAFEVDTDQAKNSIDGLMCQLQGLVDLTSQIDERLKNLGTMELDPDDPENIEASYLSDSLLDLKSDPRIMIDAHTNSAWNKFLKVMNGRSVQLLGDQWGDVNFDLYVKFPDGSSTRVPFNWRTSSEPIIERSSEVDDLRERVTELESDIKWRDAQMQDALDAINLLFPNNFKYISDAKIAIAQLACMGCVVLGHEKNFKLTVKRPDGMTNTYSATYLHEPDGFVDSVTVYVGKPLEQVFKQSDVAKQWHHVDFDNKVEIEPKTDDAPKNLWQACLDDLEAARKSVGKMVFTPETTNEEIISELNKMVNATHDKTYRQTPAPIKGMEGFTLDQPKTSDAQAKIAQLEKELAREKEHYEHVKATNTELNQECQEQFNQINQLTKDLEELRRKHECLTDGRPRVKVITHLGAFNCRPTVSVDADEVLIDMTKPAHVDGKGFAATAFEPSALYKEVEQSSKHADKIIEEYKAALDKQKHEWCDERDKVDTLKLNLEARDEEIKALHKTIKRQGDFGDEMHALASKRRDEISKLKTIIDLMAKGAEA